MTLGTFRDQIIYPDSVDDMKRKGVSDYDLEYFLEMVMLYAYFPLHCYCSIVLPFWISEILL